MINYIEIYLREVLLEIPCEVINIKPCLSKCKLDNLQKELEIYFANSSYWEEKYLDAITV